jgi:hypothetical protein
MNFSVLVYPVRHIAKPQSSELVKARDSFKLETMEPHELLTLQRRGYGICPCIFNGAPISENFRQQQIFIIDVDNDGTFEFRSVRDTIRICEHMNLVPISVYGSLSYTPANQKHHIVFCMTEPIFDKEQRLRIQKILNQIFNGDYGTLQENHIFFGGPYDFFPNRYPLDTHLIRPGSAIFTAYSPTIQNN